MATTPNLKRHADLVDRMATTLGIDLEGKMMEGALQIDTLGDVVLACTGCSDPEGCDRWLATHEGEGQAEIGTAPGMCRNSDVFALLKKGGRA